MCVSNTLETDELEILRNWARMNHLEAYLMVLSRKVDSKVPVLRVVIWLTHFHAKNAKWRM